LTANAPSESVGAWKWIWRPSRRLAGERHNSERTAVLDSLCPRPSG
jgi:hypothetical protein